MPRKRFTKPIPKTTMNISENAYQFLEQYGSARIREPKYQTLDRLINEYNSTKNNSNGEIEELREVVQFLKLENKDVKGSLFEARRKIRSYQLELGIITEQDVQLQEKNEQEIVSNDNVVSYNTYMYGNISPVIS